MFGINFGDQFREVRNTLANLEARRDLNSAVFAGGCFWCIEGPLEQEPGVVDVISGYSGGTVSNPTYEQVTGGKTGHKECVKVFYSPSRISYEKLITRFWELIDPSDDGGQFTDRGSQYRTAVFYSGDEQKRTAEKTRPVGTVTEIIPLTEFYPAEDKHQDFYRKNIGYYKEFEKVTGREKYYEEKSGLN